MSFKRLSVFTSFIVLLLGFFASAYAKPTESWSKWLASLRVEALNQGIKPEVFDDAFKSIHGPRRRILSYARHQPEHRLTFMKYRRTRADNYRVIIGQRKYRKYKPLLNEIGNKYGVNPCFIVSLWGMETSYGNYMGNFPVIESLATLAYDSKRKPFFRKQLLFALRILNDKQVDPKKFKGEWAGASGQPQFLPSSWFNYAVDYNGDGKRDIWSTRSDVFASIANYLHEHGWKAHQPWAIKVTHISGEAKKLVNTKQSRTLNEWKKLGVKTLNGQPMPGEGSLQAELIQPDGGPYMLIFNNFHVLMKWNRSTYYAGTVGYLAEKICGRPITN